MVQLRLIKGLFCPAVMNVNSFFFYSPLILTPLSGPLLISAWRTLAIDALPVRGVGSLSCPEVKWVVCCRVTVGCMMSAFIIGPIWSSYVPFHTVRMSQQFFFCYLIGGCDTKPTYFKNSKSGIIGNKNCREKNPGICLGSNDGPEAKNITKHMLFHWIASPAECEPLFSF